MDFRFFGEQVSDTSFDMKKVQENMRASDTIISFLPKGICRFSFDYLILFFRHFQTK